MQELNDEEVELQVPQKFVDLFEENGLDLLSNVDQETPADFCKSLLKFCFSGDIMDKSLNAHDPLVVEALAWILSYHDHLAKQLTSIDADYSDNYIAGYDLSFMHTNQFYSMLVSAMKAQDEASQALFGIVESLEHSSLIMLNAIDAKLGFITKKDFVNGTLKIMNLADKYSKNYYDAMTIQKLERLKQWTNK